MWLVWDCDLTVPTYFLWNLSQSNVVTTTFSTLNFHKNHRFRMAAHAPKHICWSCEVYCSWTFEFKLRADESWWLQKTPLDQECYYYCVNSFFFRMIPSAERLGKNALMAQSHAEPKFLPWLPPVSADMYRSWRVEIPIMPISGKRVHKRGYSTARAIESSKTNFFRTSRQG